MEANRPTGVRIREARQEDAEALAQLSAQLGYPATAGQIRERLAQLAQDPAAAIVVAEVEDGAVAGWMQLLEQHVLEAGGRVEIAGLVVDSRYRRSAIGRALMERAEQWARERGLRAVNLRSNVTRAAAHAFYQSLGYEHVKTQKAFRKQL
jgi:ribosomal protein S18 acetylase RimI-like enzyme